jgi:murein DD-endopeptidase MepM/ murein hydrolase activator NlpD
VLKAQLVDEETRRAYEAELAKQRAKEAQQQQEAAAAAAAAAAEAAAQNASANAVPESTAPPTTVGSSRSSNTPTAQPTAASVAVPLAVAPLPAAPAPAVTAPQPPPPPVLVGGDWLCPVAGPNAFGDTWGAARSGGRTHQGVDMMSPYGTPVVAVVSGFSTPKVNNLGGNTVSLVGDDGNRYYYAHLSSWEGGARAVAQGEVLGYVGHTGDTSANHLHFEIHPGGGAAVNPYPTVRAHC